MSDFDDMLDRAMEDQLAERTTMDDAEMLEQLDVEGAEAGSNFNDGDDVMGYFGWRVSGGLLTITYKTDPSEGDPVITERAWRLEAAD